MTIYYVRPVNGSDSDAGTSFETAFLTTQAAVDEAVAGDIVRLIPESVEEITSSILVNTNSGTASNPIIFEVGNTTDGGKSITLTYEIKATAAIAGIISFYAVSDYTRWYNVVLNGNNTATYCFYNPENGSDGHYFYNCELKSATNSGAVIRGTSSWHFVKCSVHDNTQMGIRSNATASGPYACINSLIYNNGSHGLYGGSSTLIQNCAIYKNGGTGITLTADATTSRLLNNTVANNSGDGIYFTSGSPSRFLFTNNMVCNNGGFGVNLNGMTQYILMDASGNNFYNNTSGSWSGAITAWSYTEYNPQFVSVANGSEDYRIHGSVYTGFPSASNSILAGASTVYGDWPDIDYVIQSSGISSDGEQGNYIEVSAVDVRQGVVFGPDGSNSYVGEAAVGDYDVVLTNISTKIDTLITLTNDIPTTAELPDVVWDEAISGHSTTGSTGESLTNAAAGSEGGVIDANVVQVLGVGVETGSDPVGDISDVKTVVTGMEKLLEANQVVDLSTGTLQYIDASDGVTVLLTKHCYTETNGSLVKITAKTDIITSALSTEV